MQTTLIEAAPNEGRDGQTGRPPGPIAPIVPYDSHPSSATPAAPVLPVLPTPQPARSSPAPSSERVDLVAVAIAAACGGLFTLVVLPAWGPVLIRSLVGAEPKAYWYLSRASAMVAFALLWMSMASGLLITNKLARIWPGAFTAFDLHQYTSLLGLGFGLFHALILLGDRYIGYSLAQVLVPFAGAAYRPLWVGLGQIGLYLSVVVSFTFYIRKQLGNRLWRLIHFFSFAAFAMVLAHGVQSGTDTANPWVSWMYWLAGGSLLALGIYRVLIKQLKPAGRVSRAS